MLPSEVLRIRVNGSAREALVPSNRTLLDLLRDELGQPGAKRGCDDASCGACTVLVDGEPRLACISLALCLDGAEVTTIEGLGGGGRLTPLEEAFVAEGGLQCGYCTPGFVLAAHSLLERNPAPSEEEIREGLSNNICRCTGYVRIVEAVKRAAARKAGAAAPGGGAAP